MRKVNQKQQGFTLLELVVVVALLGLVTSLATNYVVEESIASRIENTKSSRLVIKQALEDYYNEKGYFPEDLSALTDPDAPFLLDVQFEVCKDSSGSIISNRVVLRDGWGNGNCEGSTSTNLYKNFGWIYVGVSGKSYTTASGANSAAVVSNSDTEVYLRSLGPTDSMNDVFPLDDYPLVTASSASASGVFLTSVTSGGVSTLTCKNKSDVVIDISECIN